MADQLEFSVTTSQGNNQRSGQNVPTKTISCDMCRQRKVKCDKHEPCSRCTASFLDCTYSEPARKKRKTAISERIKFLEGKIKAMEAPNQTATPPSSRPSPSVLKQNSSNQGSPNQETFQNGPPPSRLPVANTPYASVYHSVNKGDIEFQGFSADRTFVQGIKQQLGYWGDDFMQQMYTRLPIISVSGLFDTSSRAPVEVKLPSKPIAIKLVEAALEGQILFSIIHRPSFDSLFNLIYSLNESDYSINERRFLPLLYAVLANGCLFADKDVMDQLDSADVSGTQYYEKSRQLQNIAECKDLVSLQAVIFKILFLLVSSRVYTCYTYISTALSLVMRMGLHRGFTNSQDFIARETAKRLFWALWVVANDTSIICGLPMLLNSDLIDQESPVEVNDIYIEQEKISQPLCNEFCPVAAANTYRRLQRILQDVTHHIYSENRVVDGQQVGIMSHAVSVENLKGLEDDMKRWALGLTDYLKLGKHFDNRQILTTQFTLSIMYAHAQLYLYRPFLQHFMKFEESTNSPEHMDLPWLATLCVQACENIVMLCEDMHRRGLLRSGNWPASRALLSSTHTLFYVILTSSGTRPWRSISRCLAIGRKLSDRLAERNVPAHRWKVIMTVMIATLPSSARHIQERMNDLETKLPDIELFGSEGKEPDDSYTETLGKQALNLLNSNSSTADKLRWLPPHLLDAHGLDSLQTAGSLSPSWRMMSYSKLAMHGHIQEPYDIATLDPAEEYLFDQNNELGIGLDPMGMPFGSGEGGFGNIDDFLGLQNWL